VILPNNTAYLFPSTLNKERVFKRIRQALLEKNILSNYREPLPQTAAALVRPSTDSIKQMLADLEAKLLAQIQSGRPPSAGSPTPSGGSPTPSGGSATPNVPSGGSATPNVPSGGSGTPASRRSSRATTPRSRRASTRRPSETEDELLALQPRLDRIRESAEETDEEKRLRIHREAFEAEKRAFEERMRQEEERLAEERRLLEEARHSEETRRRREDEEIRRREEEEIRREEERKRRESEERGPRYGEIEEGGLEEEPEPDEQIEERIRERERINRELEKEARDQEIELTTERKDEMFQIIETGANFGLVSRTEWSAFVKEFFPEDGPEFENILLHGDILAIETFLQKLRPRMVSQGKRIYPQVTPGMAAARHKSIAEAFVGV